MMFTQSTRGASLVVLLGLLSAASANADGGGSTKSPQEVYVTGGSINVDNFPSSQTVVGTVSVDNFPGSQNVSGTVNIGNLPATQKVSGSVSVDNFPSAQTINGTVTVGNVVGVDVLSLPVLPATVPVSINAADFFVYEDTITAASGPLNTSTVIGLAYDVLLHKFSAESTTIPSPTTGRWAVQVGSDSSGSFVGKTIGTVLLCSDCGQTTIEFNPPIYIDASTFNQLKAYVVTGNSSSKISSHVTFYYSRAE